MKDQAIIRPMDRADLSDLLVIEGEDGWTRDNFVQAELVLHAKTVVVDIDELAVSFMTIRYDRPCIEILNCGTRRSYQRKGHARRLIEELIRNLRTETTFHAIKAVCGVENFEFRGLMQACGIHEIHAPVKGYYEDGTDGVLFCLTKESRQPSR